MIRRLHDGMDFEHGPRGAAFAATLRGTLFDLSDAHFDLLSYACTWHPHGEVSDDPTIGTCWDADRLDLERIGCRPVAQFMSTEFGRKIAARGSIQSFLQEAE